MIIFGVDPGTQLTGFGIIKSEGNKISYIKSGIIKTSSKSTLSEKLKKIYEELDKEIKLTKPDVFCIETAFYGKNVQSALKIGYVRGAAMVVASINNIEVVEYSPREIKKSVVGNGAASKEQVQYMIKNLLNINIDDVKFDETDALAAGVCHSVKINSYSSKGESWKAFIENNPDKIVKR